MNTKQVEIHTWSRLSRFIGDLSDSRRKTVDFGKSTYSNDTIYTGIRGYWFEYTGY